MQLSITDDLASLVPVVDLSFGTYSLIQSQYYVSFYAMFLKADQ